MGEYKTSDEPSIKVFPIFFFQAGRSLIRSNGLIEHCWMQWLCWAASGSREATKTPTDMLLSKIITLMSGFSLSDYFQFSSSTMSIVNASIDADCSISLPKCQFFNDFIDTYE